MLRILLLGFLMFSYAYSIQNNIELLSVDDENEIVEVSWKLMTPKKLNNVNILLNDQEIKSIFNKEIKTSIFFLIDTSIPMKESFNEGIKPLLENIIKELNSTRHSYAIAGFDKDLNVVKKFDDNFDAYESALDNMEIEGHRTELYRLSLDAMDNLINESSERKILVLISDGDFEDTTYSVSDLVKKANKNKIQILSFGYRDSVKIQGIQRPALETNGNIWIADKHTHKMKPSFLEEVLLYFDNGGKVTFSKKDFLPTVDALQLLNLKVETQSSVLEKAFTIHVEKILKKEKVDKVNYTYYILTAAILIFTIIFLLMRSKKNETVKDIDDVVEKTTSPIAFLETQSGEKYEILNDMTSIGRNDDNNIVISGSYISSYHADIIHKHNEFYISDKNSTNGIGVNSSAIKTGNNKITQSKLSDGDKIYLGPLELIFKIKEQK